MLPVSPASETLEGTLREVVETLAPIDRTPCSPGERQAADWLAARLRGSDAVATVFFGIVPQPLFDFANHAAASLTSFL